MNSAKTSVLENRLKVLDMKLIDGDLNSLDEYVLVKEQLEKQYKKNAKGLV